MSTKKEDDFGYWIEVLEKFRHNVHNGLINDWDTDSDEEIPERLELASITEEELNSIDIDKLKPNNLSSFRDMVGEVNELHFNE